MKFPHRIGFIGFGNMAGAILNGILSNRLLDPGKIGVFDSNSDKKTAAEALGVTFFASNDELAKSCEYVLFAVKPQCSYEILESVDFSNNVLISIMAGVKLGKLVSLSGCSRVARCMPNTPCMVGKGAIAADVSMLEEEQKRFVMQILASTGTVVEMPDAMMDTVTAVSGSGPAYVYLFIKGMIDEGVKLGLSFDQAKQLTAATFEGAACLLKASDRPIDDLVDSVCSKGGTTIEAVNSFRSDDIGGIIATAMEKCYDRSVELGKL